ncbi:MAG: hypothetical protein KIC77_11415 [Clostridiales bacterium]|nr:hypothetical protein [Clostridiales bacterium]
MKKIKVVIFLSIISILLGGCNYFTPLTFGNIKIGENFMGSRDGYYKKLPYNYCLSVNYRSNVELFKVADEHINEEWLSSNYYDSAILKGHYIQGFYNENYLVLCEEKKDNTLLYLSFDFSSSVVQYYPDTNEMNKSIGITSQNWFSLCNTNQEIGNIK